MTFIPRGSKMTLNALADTNIILFGFTTTIIRTDMEMLECFCTHAGKKDCTFNTLPICNAMNNLLQLIKSQLHEQKLKHSGICHIWNKYFFHMMVECKLLCRSNTQSIVVALQLCTHKALWPKQCEG